MAPSGDGTAVFQNTLAGCFATLDAVEFDRTDCTAR